MDGDAHTYQILLKKRADVSKSGHVVSFATGYMRDVSAPCRLPGLGGRLFNPDANNESVSRRVTLIHRFSSICQARQVIALNGPSRRKTHNRPV
jgi:hypothetical protein